MSQCHEVTMSQCTFFQDNILKFENKFVSLQTEKTMNMTKDECIALLDALDILEDILSAIERLEERTNEVTL